MRDYTIFYKDYFDVTSKLDLKDAWDVLLSAYSLDERVQRVFNEVSAKKKYWLVHHEYAFKAKELPSENSFVKVYAGTDQDEAQFISNFFKSHRIDWAKVKLCIDTTRFTRPALIYLLLHLKKLGVKKFDTLYSEPNYYSNREKTVFSDAIVTEIKQIPGYEGHHSVDHSKDVLIMGTGYDHALISQVAEERDYYKKFKIFGFPSLRADMYQENVLQVQKAGEAVGYDISLPYGHFAPAYDPFVTASVLHRILDDLNKDDGYTNIYLCTLGTKAQALGFSLFYLTECINLPISIIHPYCLGYSKKDSEGLSRVWKYTIEF